jgi:hypothetical protein
MEHTLLFFDRSRGLEINQVIDICQELAEFSTYEARTRLVIHLFPWIQKISTSSYPNSYSHSHANMSVVPPTASLSLYLSLCLSTSLSNTAQSVYIHS